MPAKIHYAIARQWELLKLLPRRMPGKSSGELHRDLEDAGYKINKRTVERDLNQLLTLFPITCNNKGTPHGWYWPADAYGDLPALTLAEAMTTRMLEDFLRPLLPTSILENLEPRSKHASAKLAAMVGNPLSNWNDKVRVVPAGLNLLPPKIDPLVLETVQNALLADEQLEVQYRSAHRDQPTEQTIHPLGLVQRGPASYLVATAFDYQDARIYALHRIASATRTCRKINRPPGFSLDGYIKTGALEFGDGEFIRLKASISHHLGKLLEETPLSSDMMIKKRRQDSLLSCTIADTWQLHWWILSHGSEIEVLEPETLRQAVIDEVRKMEKVYL